MLQSVGVDAKVISFSYLSKFRHRCDIEQAADDLRTWLQTEFVNYRHIIMVTHSTGGLLVKSMLCQAFAEFEKTSDPQFNYASSESLWFRVRRVINISVPHQGGSPVLSILGSWVYNLIYVLFAPILGILRFCSQGRLDWGRNRIVGQLRFRNKWILKLDSNFRKYQDRMREMDLPRPTLHDVSAKSDLSVPVSAASERTIYFRGTHKSIKIPRRPSAPIVSIVSTIFKEYVADIGCSLVDKEMVRIAAVNKATQSEKLIDVTLCGIDQDRDQPRPVVATQRFGTQAEVAQQAIDAILSEREQSRQLVITGSAGVGKSLVVRTIAWRLGVGYLADPEGPIPMPLFIPLQQVTLSSVEVQKDDLWKALWEWWLNWGHALYPHLKGDLKWLENRFKNRPTTIILDGLDDFVHNHSNLGFSTVQEMLREAVTRYSNNSQLSILMGIRNSFHGIERLVSDPKSIFEVLRLSVAQAKYFYPSCSSWVSQVNDRKLLDLILTPLILSNYEPDPSCEFSQQGLSQASIMCQTIQTILSRSRLVGSRLAKSGVIEVTTLGRALMLIAWIFYCRSRGEIHIGVLVEEAKGLVEEWERYFEDLKLSDERFFQETLSDDVDGILAGFRLVSNMDYCRGILQATVFIPTGPNSVRFAHRHWQEFLLGQYLSLSIRSHHFDQLGKTAFHVRIYRFAGETFAPRIISEKCIHSLLNAWERTGNTFITGNVIAFLTWTKTVIDPRAIKLLIDRLLTFEPLSRLVLIGGLCYRVLEDNPEDYTVAELRRALLPQLKEFSNPNLSRLDDPVIASMSWCYQKAFSKLFGLQQPESDWPEIGFDDEETIQALPMVCTIENGRYLLDDRSRTLQFAFLIPIQESYNDYRLAIRAVHYLYYLVVARKHGVHILELSYELPQLLKPGCQFEEIVQSFDIVPEVLRLYRSCQAYHQHIDTVAI